MGKISMQKLVKLIMYLVGCILIASVIVFFTEGYFRRYFFHEITFYPALCQKSDYCGELFFLTDSNGVYSEGRVSNCLTDFGVNNSCEYPLVLPSVTYKISKNPNEILYWSDDGKVEKLTNCAIKNYKNWQCAPEEKVSIALVDGKLNITSSNYDAISEQNIGRIMNDAYNQGITKKQWLLLKEKATNQ